MKFRFLLTIFILSALVFAAATANAQKKSDKKAEDCDGDASQKAAQKASEKDAEDQDDVVEVEDQDDAEEQTGAQVRTIVADPAVIISVCLQSGSVVVKGSDRKDVVVRAEDAANVLLRRAENPEATTPATRVEVLISDSSKGNQSRFGECRGNSNVELDVPRGATIFVTTREGDIEVSDVAEIKADTKQGNVNINRSTRSAEANTTSGDIAIENSVGRARLATISGGVEAVNLKMATAADTVEVSAISGDIRLEQVQQARVNVSTISGDLDFSGPLARGGSYSFTTTNGDITLTMPESSAFEVNAKVSQGGEIVTDFPLKYPNGLSTAENPKFPTGPLPAKLVGTYGTEPLSRLKLTSFSGTLRLRKM